MSATYSLADVRRLPVADTAAQSLSWMERIALGLAIWEIPLQIDKYFMFHQNDSELGAVGGINISVATFAIIALYAIWGLRAAAERGGIQAPIIFGFPMLIYIGFVMLSILVAAVPLLAVFDIVVLAQAYALFFFLANRVRRREDILFCLFALMATLLTQTILVAGLAALGPRAHGMRYDVGPVSLSVWSDGRVAGTLFSAVVCGSMMAILWLPIMASTLTLRNRRFWAFAMFVTAAGMIAVFLTQTRGAILTMFTGSMIITVLLWFRGWLPRWTLYAAAGLAVLGIYPLLTTIRQRVISGDEGSAESRIHLSLIAMEVIKDEPLFGHGAGNCHLAALSVADSGKFRSEWYYTIHSKYLLTWVETGVFGLLSYLFLLGNAIRYGVLSWFSRDRLLAPLGMAMSAGIVGQMLHMTVDIFNSRSQVQMLWVIIGISAAIYRATRLTPSTSRSGGSLGVA